VNLSDVQRLIELAGMKNHSGVQSLLRAYTVSGDEGLLRDLLEMVQPLAAMAKASQPFPGPTALIAGDVLAGSALMMNGEAAGPVSIPVPVFNTHLAVLGGTGSGKSYTIAGIGRQLIEKGASILILDTEDEYAGMLVPFFGADRLAVCDINSWRYNLHELIGTEDALSAISRIEWVLREEWVGIGGANLIGECLDEEYKLGTPTVESVLARLARMKPRYGTRYGNYYDSVLNRYKALKSIPMFSCGKGFPLEALVDRSCIFRLPRLAPDHRVLVINAIMKAVTTFLDLRGWGQLYIVMDEFHRFATKQTINRNDRSETLVLENAHTLRKRGGLIIGDQIPSYMPPQIIALTNTKLILKLEHGDDARVIGDALHLSKEQREYLTSIPPRHGVLYCPQLGTPDAFLVRLPDLDFSRRASKEEIEQRMKDSVAGLEWSERSEPARQTVTVERAKEPEAKPVASRSGISMEAQKYLVAINAVPFLAATKRDASLGMTVWTGNHLREELLNAGLVKPHELKTGKRGRATLLLEITEKGEEELKSLKVKIRRREGIGGFLHQACASYIWDFYKRTMPNARIKIEDESSGKSVDVSVVDEAEGRSIAVEIVIEGVTKEEKNLRHDLLHYTEIVFVSNNAQTLEKVKRTALAALSQVDRDRVAFRLLASLLTET
jgi:hypothetical protein